MAPEPERSLIMRSRNAGRDVVKVASEFLRQRPQRRIGDDAGPISSHERTLYLIDVIPEARLAR